MAGFKDKLGGTYGCLLFSPEGCAVIEPTERLLVSTYCIIISVVFYMFLEGLFTEF